MSLPLCTGTSFSPRRSPDSPPLTRAPSPPLPRPLYPPPSSRTPGCGPPSTPDPLPRTHPPPPLRGNLIFRDDDATSTTPSAPPLRFPSSQGKKIPRPPWNVRDNAKARLWINFVRGYEVLFLFFFFYFSLSVFSPLWVGFCAEGGMFVEHE